MGHKLPGDYQLMIKQDSEDSDVVTWFDGNKGNAIHCRKPRLCTVGARQQLLRAPYEAKLSINIINNNKHMNKVFFKFIF